MNRIPKHVAIIMDGNGRWAEKRGENRIKGHIKGVKSVKIVVEEAVKSKIKFLTLFAFSTENWKRPKTEINTLMKLLVSSLKDEFEELNKNNIKLNTIGNINNLPNKVQKQLNYVQNKTSKNSGMVLTLAVSYGSKEEITNALRIISDKVKNNIISIEKVDQHTINNHLYTYDLPDVDLLIRSSGEQRISNFLLWQIAYAELYFTNILWPDFNKLEFYKALDFYNERERRFGKTSKQIND
ncbi:MAG: di-trans,poly-cis-decaprenylcistransferase [Flavobacteriaceae bacterium]|nr:di-trans,poly-cis-decaprenylcistransferase [Flavobacteriaceae bacterium]|tara:strand:- start:58794 stop:59513 length:720 start_codon:yes stop_codon:yes gene_type:complete